MIKFTLISLFFILALIFYVIIRNNYLGNTIKYYYLKLINKFYFTIFILYFIIIFIFLTLLEYFNITLFNFIDVESSINLYNKYKEQIEYTFNMANTKAKEIVNILDNTKEKFMVDNPIFNFNFIKDYKEYLSTLSTMEICLVINITSCVFIFTCIISILFALSGNYLIDKFSLEKKLPKLSKIIQLRVKFQNYYIIINSVFIILALLSLMFVNILTLIKG